MYSGQLNSFSGFLVGALPLRRGGIHKGGTKFTQSKSGGWVLFFNEELTKLPFHLSSRFQLGCCQSCKEFANNFRRVL